MSFVKATRKKLMLRMAISGPTKSGKTYSSLALATALSPGSVAVIDPEAKSSLYAGDFEFDVNELRDHSAESYIAAIDEAARDGYGCLIIDSLSHAWMGAGGILEAVDAKTKSSKSKNAFSEGWREMSPVQRRLIDSILRYPGHVIATMRSKMAYEMVKGEDGKVTPTRIGLAPVQRNDVEYEFDIVSEMHAGTMTISGGRAPALNDKVIHHPGRELAEMLLAWLTNGKDDPSLYPVSDEEFAALPTALALLESGEDVRATGMALRQRMINHRQPPALVEGLIKIMKAESERRKAEATTSSSV